MICMSEETFPQRLERMREERGMSRRDVSVIADVSESYVFRLEKGHTKAPSYWVMRGLAKALGVTMEELAEGNVEANGAGWESEEQVIERQARAWQRPGLKHADMVEAITSFGKLPVDDLQFIIQLLQKFRREAEERKEREAHAD